MSRILRAIGMTVIFVMIGILANPVPVKASVSHSAVAQAQTVAVSAQSIAWAPEVQTMVKAAYVPPVRKATPVTHYVTVKANNTLTEIAKSLKIAWQSLYCENKSKIGTNPDYIRPGERLLIPTVRLSCKIEDGTKPAVVHTTANIQQANNSTSSSQSSYQAPQGQTGLQQIAWNLLPVSNRAAEFACLNNVIMRESAWNIYATNPGSGAYGIPQALPGSKMAVAGSDWATDGYTQLRWMIVFYIGPVYGDSCNAWYFELTHGYY